MKRRRYKFVGRAGNRYVWQSVERMPGDSRVEEIRCAVDWFWNPVGVSGGTATKPTEQER